MTTINSKEYWEHDVRALRMFNMLETLEGWTYRYRVPLVQSKIDDLLTLLTSEASYDTQAQIKEFVIHNTGDLLVLLSQLNAAQFYRCMHVLSQHMPLVSMGLCMEAQRLTTKDASLFVDRIKMLISLGMTSTVFTESTEAMINVIFVEDQFLNHMQAKQVETISETNVLSVLEKDDTPTQLLKALESYPTLVPGSMEVQDMANLTDYFYNSFIQFYPQHNRVVSIKLLGAEGLTEEVREQLVRILENMNGTIVPLNFKHGTGSTTPDIIPESLEAEEQAQNGYEWVKYEAVKNFDFSPFSLETQKKAEKHILSIKNHKPTLKVKDFSVFDSLYENNPNFSEVISFYKGSFILNQSKPDTAGYSTPIPILLVGDPGIGKTHFAKALANALETDNYFIDSNSISASWVLGGSSPSWKDANAGLIFKYMNQGKTVSPVIIFDEIDKLSSNKNYDPFSTFHQLLEPLNAKTFTDEFLNLEFDASKIIYILSANDMRSIPDSLLSRMKVFHIQKPNEAQSRVIAQNIYSEILDGSPLFTPELSEQNLVKLSQYTPREMKQVIMDSLFSQVINLAQEKMNEVSIKSKGERARMGF